MTVTTENPSEQAKAENSRFYELSRKLMLASIGAAAMAQEELEAFVDKLVERGELADKDGKGLVAEMRAKRHQRMEKVENEVSKHVSRVLERLNIPSKEEIAALNEKIAALNKKLDEMKK